MKSEDAEARNPSATIKCHIICRHLFTAKIHNVNNDSKEASSVNNTLKTFEKFPEMFQIFKKLFLRVPMKHWHH